MPDLASVMKRRGPARLGDLVSRLGFDPALPPSLAAGGSNAPVPTAMEAASGVSPDRYYAARNPTGGMKPAPQNAMGAYANGAPTRLGDLAPVNLVASPVPADGPTLGDVIKGLPQGDLHKKPALFGKDGVGWKILGVLGDSITAAGGGQPTYGPAMLREHELERERQFDLDKFNYELEAKRQQALAPHLEQVGDTIGMVDGRAGTYQPIYSQPSSAESYAAALGYKPGSQEYADAAREYVLRGYSDYATGNKLDLIDHRFDRSDRQLGQRLATTQRGQDLRYSSTTRGQNLTHQDRQSAIAQSNTNNIRTTDTSASNNANTNRTRMVTARRVNPANANAGAPVKVNSIEEARRLAPGTTFITPDGKLKVR